MAISKQFTSKKLSALLILMFAANGSIFDAQAEQTSVMPLHYVSEKAISSNPEVQQAWHAFKASM